MRVDPVTGHVGAEIGEVDLRSLDDDDVAAIRRALLDHQVVFFRDQDLDDRAHLDLARRFGEVMPALIEGPAGEVEGVTVLDQVAPRGLGTDRWHADTTFAPEPPMGAILRAVDVPAVGGDTLFASMYAAYELLSGPIRRLVDGLTAVHSTAIVNQLMQGADVVRRAGAEQISVHPVVRTHPETGRKLLFVNGNFTTRIVELSFEESEAVLRMLFDQVKSPMVQCRFRWTEGSVAFWDNRAVQHFASPDYTVRRVMHRVLLAGDRPR